MTATSITRPGTSIMPLPPVARLAIAMLLIGAAQVASGAVASDFLYGTLPKTGAEANDLPYRLLVPSGYSPASSYPLILFLHGQGEKGSDNNAQLANNANGALQLVSTANQAAYPCFMLAPQAAWGWDAESFGQIDRLITQLEGTYAIDRDRICITGLSMGGGGTWDFITRYPNLFAAAVPMSGWGATGYENITHLPIWDFHAANDGTVGVNGSDNPVSILRGIGGRVIYTRYATGGHGIWPTAYATPSLLPWMMAQRRNTPVSGSPILSVTTPTPHVAAPPAVSTMTISGTATMAGGVAKVGYTFAPWTGSIDASAMTMASGTSSWSAGAIPVSNTYLLVLCEGSSWSASLGGITTVNDFLYTLPAGTNTAAPTIAVTSPTTTGSFTTSATSIGLAGTAAAAGGKTIGDVTWTNDRGGQGQGFGTTSWSMPGLSVPFGDTTFTVRARDSANIVATTVITVHVTGGTANTAPTISSITGQTTAEDVAKTGIAFTVGDAETAAGALTVTATSNNPALLGSSGLALGGSGSGRTLTATPIANQNGSATITVTVSDGSLTASSSFVLTVTAVNDAPTVSAIADQSIAAGGSTGALPFTVGDLETPAGSLTLSASSTNTALIPLANVVFTGAGANRAVTVTPAAGQSGNATIAITVSDGSATVQEAFVVTVVVGNTAPSITAIADRSTAEDTATGAIAFTIADAQTSAASLSLTATSSDTSLVPLAGISFGGSGASRTVTVTPAPNGNGTATITVTVSDGTLTASEAFVLTVTAVNDAPTLSASFPAQSLTAGAAATTLAFTIGDADTSTSALSVSATTSDGAVVPLANLVLAGSGASRTLSVTPGALAGSATITVTVSDGVLSTSRSFVATVSAPSAPSASASSSRTEGGHAHTGGSCGLGGSAAAILLALMCGLRSSRPRRCTPRADRAAADAARP